MRPPGASQRAAASSARHADRAPLLTSRRAYAISSSRIQERNVPVPPTTQSDALRGTIDLLVLKTLLAGPLHGWGIGERIQQISRGVLEVNQGSLYPALQRLEHRGAIQSEWGMSENNRRARYYRLTPAGRKAFSAEAESWRRFAAAVETVLVSP